MTRTNDQYDADALAATLEHFGFPADDEKAVEIARRSLFFAGAKLALIRADIAAQFVKAAHDVVNAIARGWQKANEERTR